MSRQITLEALTHESVWMEVLPTQEIHPKDCGIKSYVVVEWFKDPDQNGGNGIIKLETPDYKEALTRYQFLSEMSRVITALCPINN